MTDSTSQLSLTAVLWGDPDSSALLKVPNPSSSMVSDLRPLAAANLLGNVPLPTLNRLKLYDISAENVRTSDSRLRQNGMTVTEVFPNAVLLDPFQIVMNAFPNISNGRTIQLVIVSPPEDPSALISSPPPYEPARDNSLSVPNPTRTAVLVKNGVPREDVPSWEGTAAAILPTLPSTPSAETAPANNTNHSTADLLNEKLGYFGRHSQDYEHAGDQDPDRQGDGSGYGGDGTHGGSKANGGKGAAAGTGAVSGGNFHYHASGRADDPFAHAAAGTSTSAPGLARLSADDRPKHYVTVSDGPRKKFALTSTRRKVACCVIILLLLALTVGLAVGLSKRTNDPSPPSPPDPANDPTAPAPPTNSSNNSPNSSPSNSPDSSPPPTIPTVTSSIKTLTLPKSEDSIRDIALALNSNTLFASYGNNVQEWKTDTWSTTLHEAEQGATSGGSITGNLAVEETIVMSVGTDGTIRTWEIGKPGGPTQYRWPASTGGATQVTVATLGTQSHPIFGNSLGLWRCLDSGSTSLSGDSTTTSSPRHNLKSIIQPSSIHLFTHGGSQNYGYIEHWEFTSKPATSASLLTNITIPTSHSPPSIPPQSTTKSFDISPDTSFTILSFNPGPTLQIETSTGKQISEFRFARGELNTTALVISPDGKYLFTAHDVEGGSTIVQWDIGNRTQVKKFVRHQGSVIRVLVSYDGKYLYSADKSGIQQWALS